MIYNLLTIHQADHIPTIELLFGTIALFGGVFLILYFFGKKEKDDE